MIKKLDKPYIANGDIYEKINELIDVVNKLEKQLDQLVDHRRRELAADIKRYTEEESISNNK